MLEGCFKTIVKLTLIVDITVKEMARGHQKLQSQAKTQEKTAKAKKQQGHSATEQKKAAQKALVHACVVCKVSIKFITNIVIVFRKTRCIS